uniref:High mobility group nucleosome binding domain 1 n=1 Tax=Otolemur garnettii TaxID=30611 RepID=H0XNI2_OTOGA
SWSTAAAGTQLKPCPPPRCQSFHFHPAPEKVEMKPKKVAARDKSSDKKVLKGKRGAKGKQAEVANQETKDLSAENGETKTEENPATEKAGEKEAKSD